MREIAFTGVYLCSYNKAVVLLLLNLLVQGWIVLHKEIALRSWLAYTHLS